MMAYVSEERREKILRNRQPLDRKLSLYGALLLPYACSKEFGLSFQETDPVWPSRGKPYLRTHSEIHFSIAHSGGCAAAAVSDEEIGIDAELIREAPMRALKRAFSASENERILASSNSNLEFFRIWTRKEAYGKYLGSGITRDVLQADTFLPEHNDLLSEGILTPESFLTKEQYLSRQDSSYLIAEEHSSALYYSVYSRKKPVKPVHVSHAALMEYYLLNV